MGSKDVSRSFEQQDVLENIRFENDYTEHHLDDVQVEMEYEILSIYSCSECVMHEGSNNKEHRYTHKRVTMTCIVMMMMKLVIYIL